MRLLARIQICHLYQIVPIAVAAALAAGPVGVNSFLWDVRAGFGHVTSTRVRTIAADLGVSDQTIYTWRRQELIDTGVEPGLTSVEAAELRGAKRRIAEHETELAVTRRANELLKVQVAFPEGGSRRSR